MFKFRILLPALLLGLCLPVMAQQVYRSTDSKGNVVFSDTPSEGSETITIDTPNVADSVTPPPSTQSEPVVEPEIEVAEPEQSPVDLQREVDNETDYLRNRRYFYSNGDPRPRTR